MRVVLALLVAVAIGAAALLYLRAPEPPLPPTPAPAPVELPPPPPKPVVEAAPVEKPTSQPSRKWSKEDREKARGRMEAMFAMMGLSKEEQAELEKRMELFRELEPEQRKMVGEAFRTAFEEGGALREGMQKFGQSMRSGKVAMWDVAEIYRETDGLATADKMLLSAETFDQEGVNEAVQTGYGAFFEKASALIDERSAE